MSRLIGPVMQNGYVVRDLDAAIAHWTTRVGVGPFQVFPRVAFNEIQFRGAPAAVEMAVAMAYSGDLQIELIQPLSAAPSIYTEFLASGAAGLHHLGVLTHDYAADLARLTEAGHRVVQGGVTAGGTGFAYFDTDGPFQGTMIELIEASPGMTRLFSRLRAAAAAWDGRDPMTRR